MNSKFIREKKVNWNWIREIDIEFDVNSRKIGEFEVIWRDRWLIENEFAKSIVNSKWIREIESEFEMYLRKRWWIRSDFAKEMVNSKWIRETDSEFEVNLW